MPSGSFDQAVVELEAVHTSQGLSGFVVPSAMTSPSMSQPAMQPSIELHTMPAPQLVPSGTGDHVVVELEGVHSPLHGGPGSPAPGA